MLTGVGRFAVDRDGMSSPRLATLALVGLGAGGACGGESPDAPPGEAVVERVVDGDTLDVVIGGRTERVRLLGIDTPEIAHEAFGGRPANDTECYGDEAVAYTASLLPVGTTVRLERDVVGRDDYGRLLAFVHRADDGLVVNVEIVRAGYARPLTIEPNVAYREVVVEAAREAQQVGAGLWSACG